MPRPKRTRAAATRTTAPTPISNELGQTSEASTDIYEVSDREKERSHLRRVSSGNLSRSALTSNPRQATALAAARLRRDSAMQRLENITSTSNTNDTGDDGIDPAAEDEEQDDEGSIEMGRRASATPARGGRLTEYSGLDLDDSMFDDLNTTFDTAGPASGRRSHETSTLSISGFKRRPRAGSFLSRDDGPLRPSSRADPNTPGISSTFNIGVFKRRAREPSILGTSQKPRAERPVLQSDTGDRSEDEQLGDENDEETEEAQEAVNKSGLDAESTSWLRRSSRRSGIPSTDQDVPETSTATNPRKRKSMEAHEQRQRSSPYNENGGSAVQSESEAVSSPLSLPRHLSRLSTPVMDEDVAPPVSSDSENDEAAIWPPIQSLTKRPYKRPASGLRKTPKRDLGDSISDMSSPPSLTHSPNYAEDSPPPQRAARQTRKVSKPEPKVTTADLTGMLPRRRRRNARDDPFALEDSDEEVDASGLGNDEDELSYLDVGTRRRPASRPLSRGGPANHAKGKTSGSTKHRRTYGRSSDKENQGDDPAEQEEEASSSLSPAPDVDEGPTESSEQMVARMGDELKNAARKFAEVDKWELAYEEAIPSSSPLNAR